MTAIIEVNSLTKHYGSKRGIIDVSFQVEEGDGHALKEARHVV
jgi:ABC-type Na+ transport system ATPase subunit NatA